MNVDPAAFKSYDRKKLWAIWKGVGSSYRVTLSNFTKSGNPAPFLTFHRGCLDVYYLHLLTTITRPELHERMV